MDQLANFFYPAYHGLLVGGIPAPLKNMSSAVGILTFPTEWKVIKFHGSKPPVPNHQPVYVHLFSREDGKSHYLRTNKSSFIFQKGS